MNMSGNLDADDFILTNKQMFGKCLVSLQKIIANLIIVKFDLLDCLDQEIVNVC